MLDEMVCTGDGTREKEQLRKNGNDTLSQRHKGSVYVSG